MSRARKKSYSIFIRISEKRCSLVDKSTNIFRLKSATSNIFGSLFLKILFIINLKIGDKEKDIGARSHACNISALPNNNESDLRKAACERWKPRNAPTSVPTIDCIIEPGRSHMNMSDRKDGQQCTTRI